MGFDKKYYTDAENELNGIRMKNQRTLAARERETDEKFPEVGKIRRSLAGTTSKLLRIIADRDNDIKAQLEALERENLQLQDRLKETLVRCGLPANYLDPIYDCAKCRDTGIVDGKLCECFREKVKKAAAAELSASSPLQLCGFDEFDLTYYDDNEVLPLGATARKIMAKNLSICRSYAENFRLPYNGMVLRGKTGLGKTHLSLSIAKAVTDKGYSVIYGSAPDLFRRIEKEHFGNSGDDTDTLGLLTSTDLLVLDDLGAEFESKFYVSAFYNIINDRMNRSLPTIVSTNLDLPETEKRYGERVSSRLSTMDMLIFVGSDVRFLKKRRQL
ncbi:MAG: ATP-binding protein [Ruminiclostridium sp.]|nr:ATP-binding protein [Ruminiclostridium sp.]